MNKEELNLIIREGEDHKIEFKENVSGIDREIVAFANSCGGRLFIGVDDSGKLTGLKVTNSLKSQVQDIANNCEPKIRMTMETLDNVLIVNVMEGNDKPYKCASGFYRRIGPNSQKLSRNEILDIFKSEGKVKFDEMIEPKFRYPEDFDQQKFLSFMELSGISVGENTKKMLVSMGVAEEQSGELHFKNAGVLFFAKEPQHFIPWSVFTVALFKDKAGTDVIDRKEITGGLFEIVEEVMKFVRLYSKVAYRFTGKPQRENIYEYPLGAIRETVINSVMHKYYFEHGHNNILKFLPDRIKIENYWIRPDNFVLEKTVFRRNHLIADLFLRIHFGERMGTGFERIREMCRNENAPFPQIEAAPNYFYVEFKQSDEYIKKTVEMVNDSSSDLEKDLEKDLENLTESQRIILSEVRKNRFVTQVELSRIVGINEKNIRNNIFKLKKRGLMRRIGPDKGGHWEV